MENKEKQLKIINKIIVLLKQKANLSTIKTELNKCNEADKKQVLLYIFNDRTCQHLIKRWRILKNSIYN